MSNHFHLLVHFDHPERLSPVMAGLHVAYWHHYRRRYGLVGHLFQNRFRSPVIDTDAYLLTCGRYIERNPVEAGLAAEAWSYPWSSARAYALGEGDALLSPNPWYESLAGEPGRRRQLWRDILTGEDPREEVVRQSDWAVGDESFRCGMSQLRGRPVPRRRGRPSTPAP